MGEYYEVEGSTIARYDNPMEGPPTAFVTATVGITDIAPTRSSAVTTRAQDRDPGLFSCPVATADPGGHQVPVTSHNPRTATYRSRVELRPPVRSHLGQPPAVTAATALRVVPPHAAACRSARSSSCRRLSGCPIHARNARGRGHPPALGEPVSSLPQTPRIPVLGFSLVRCCQPVRMATNGRRHSLHSPAPESPSAGES